LTDFRQTFVTGASRDRDELIRFWGQKVKGQGHTIAAEAHSTRRYRRVQLFSSSCYCLGVLEPSSQQVRGLSVCWNDCFRRIFGFKRFESVKYICSLFTPRLSTSDLLYFLRCRLTRKALLTMTRPISPEEKCAEEKLPFKRCIIAKVFSKYYRRNVVILIRVFGTLND